VTERRALLIGIDRYERLPYPLDGCVNDARVLGGLLERSFGFRPEAITWLLNDQATRDRMLAELDALVAATGQDDVVVIAYSGHGSQMTDRDGDEAEAMDETIVPYDSGRAPDENRDITDDELYVRLLALSERTPFVTLLFDCCHSGSVSRDGFGERVRWVPPDRRPASELPPSTRSRDGVPADRDLGPSGWLPLGQRYVLVAGCLDDESSYEHTVVQDGSTVTHGALTYFLTQQIAGAGPGTTYRDVFDGAAAMVTATYPRQHPQMEGASDRELFGVRDIVPMRFANVCSRAGSVVTIRAGLVHGASPGSRWGVYPPGTKEVDEQTPRLGVVELTAVRATESEGTPIEERSPDAIVVGCRAVEEAHPFGDFRLRVQVVVPREGGTELAAPIREAVETSDLLAEVPADEPADVRLYLLPAREEAGPDDPVPQIRHVTEPTWAVVGRDGELMMPLHRAGSAANVSTVVDNLESAARYRHALGLRNPQPGELDGKIQLILERADGDGWVEAEPDPATGLVSYTDGDRVAIQIRNGHDAPIHVSVLDFGVAGAVGALYPVEGASEPLAAGRSISVGERPGEEIELRLPQAAAPGGGSRGAGIETFKLIATSGPADLTALLQPGYRAVGGPSDRTSPIEELLSLALSGGGTRDAVRPTTTSTEDAWITVERSFTLREA
jgi:hypothetical protein